MNHEDAWTTPIDEMTSDQAAAADDRVGFAIESVDGLLRITEKEILRLCFLSFNPEAFCHDGGPVPRMRGSVGDIGLIGQCDRYRREIEARRVLGLLQERIATRL